MTDSSSSSPSSIPIVETAIVVKDPRYQNGKIYEIVCSHEDYLNESYIGSTIRVLTQRFCDHKAKARYDPRNNKLYQLMNLIGFDYFKIVLVELWPCDSKAELCMREQYHMRARNPSLNKNSAHKTQDDDKKKRAEYYSTHKDEYIARSKLYASIHKEARKEKNAEHYLAHRDEIIARNLRYNASHKEEKKARDNKSRRKREEEAREQGISLQAKAKNALQERLAEAYQKALAVNAEKRVK